MDNLGKQILRALARILEYLMENPTRGLIIFVGVFIGLLTLFAFRKARR